MFFRQPAGAVLRTEKGTAMRKTAHETIYDVAVIGGGASGMMAAIAAKSQLPEGGVILLERNDILGRKLLATGNGRCNFTNTLALPLDYGTSAEFTEPAMEAVNPLHVIQIFDSMGILYRVEDEGRVYPHSGQGATVTQAMERKLKQLDVRVKKNAVVEAVSYSTKFDIMLKGGKTIAADKVIIACGGKAGGQYGCQGDGYTFAKSFGHDVKKIRPALVAVNCRSDEADGRDAWKKEWKGVRSQAKVSLWRVSLRDGEETCVAEDHGEVQFTDSGLSGICVFNLSRHIVFTGNMKDGRNETYMMEVDFLPDWTEERIYHMLERRREELAEHDADALLMSVVNSRLINGLLEQVGFKGLTIVLDGVEEKTWPDLKTITDDQLMKLAKLLKGWRFEIEGTRGWNDAQVTAGGVDCTQVDPVTMESKLQRGLYLCGEVLDVDGKCGGYNLQWAFASGYTAGIHAAE